VRERGGREGEGREGEGERERERAKILGWQQINCVFLKGYLSVKIAILLSY